MADQKTDDRKSSGDDEIPEFIKRMKSGGATIIFKGNGWAGKQNNNG